MGRVKLRKIQYGIAESGGSGAATMAIFLGKQLLGQVNEPAPTPASPEQQAGAAAVMQKKSFAQFSVDAKYPAPYEQQIAMHRFALEETVPRMILGARGYGKTDYVTILSAAYDVYLHGVETSNLIVSKSKNRNAAMIEEIANALINNGVILDKQNTSCIRVQGLIGKDHSVEAVTIRTSLRGRHPKRTFMDDPVTEEDVSEAMRALVKRKYNEIMKLCANVVVIGQPAHAYDLYAELRGIVKKLELPYGSIPELDHDLEAQRLAGVDEASIQASYYLNIESDGSMPFAKINYLDVYPPGPSIAMIDPSDGGDFTALSIFRGYGNGVAVVGDAWKKPWYHCLEEIVKLLLAHGVTRLAFETNATGRQPIDQLTKLLAPYGIGVVGTYSTTNKHAAIVATGSVAHQIHLSRTSGKNYTDQVVKYESGAKHDDAPDSLARGLEWTNFIRVKKLGV